MRVFGDGFDHYGTNNGYMLDGVYAQVDAGELSTFAATGAGSFFANGKSGLNDLDGLRKVLPTAIDKIGCQGRFYFPSLPAKNYCAHIYSLLTDSPQRAQLSFIVDANGAMRVVRGRQTYQNNGDTINGSPEILVAQSDPILTAAAWHHIECQAYIHSSSGWVRVAIDGIHRFSATGLNTQYDTTKVVSVAQHQTYLDNVGNFYLDDYVIYDFTGTSSTDTDWCPTVDGSGMATTYIGDLQGIWLPPNGNTAQDDWSKSTGSSAYALVDESPPDDTDYIYATAVNNITELDLTDLDTTITYIRGVDWWARANKADAGAADIKIGTKSSASTTDSSDIPVTVAPTYYWTQINVDPATSTRWTRTGLNAAKYRIKRSV